MFEALDFSKVLEGWNLTVDIGVVRDNLAAAVLVLVDESHFFDSVSLEDVVAVNTLLRLIEKLSSFLQGLRTFSELDLKETVVNEPKRVEDVSFDGKHSINSPERLDVSVFDHLLALVQVDVEAPAHAFEDHSKEEEDVDRATE